MGKVKMKFLSDITAEISVWICTEKTSVAIVRYDGKVIKSIRITHNDYITLSNLIDDENLSSPMIDEILDKYYNCLLNL